VVSPVGCLRFRLPVAVLPLVLATGGLALTAAEGEGTFYIDPARMLVAAERHDFRGANLFSVVETEAGPCLRSIPDHSASGLYQPVTVAAEALRRVQWRWRVDEIHASADIRVLAREDFAAKVAFVFGEPTFFNRGVPTLAYVWTSTPVANGSVIASWRYRNLRYVQLRGSGDVGKWQIETRDVIADFLAVCGQPPSPLKYVAVFNDNDQTGERTSALFGSARGPVPPR